MDKPPILTAMSDAIRSHARRAILLDRVAELLEAWATDHPQERAAAMLELVEAHGWKLPTWGLDDRTLIGPGSTPAGRARARALFEAARAQRTIDV